MPTKFIDKSSSPAAGSTGAHAGIGVNSSTNNLTFNPDGTKRIVVHQGQAAATETVAATNVITAAESGKIFFLSDATEFVSTLPLPAAGLEFEFYVANAPETASYTVYTNGGANIMVGHIVTCQDAGGSSDSEVSGGDTYTFVDSKAVIGDRARFVSDGTNWFVTGYAKVFDGASITTAA